jgi:plasmid maintenance system antidote protein VapI
MTTSGKDTRFGDALRSQLAKRNLMQVDLAEALKVSPTYVSSISTGSKRVSSGGVMTISKALDLSPKEEVVLYRAAAEDQGFKLDIPDEF